MWLGFIFTTLRSTFGTKKRVYFVSPQIQTQLTLRVAGTHQRVPKAHHHAVRSSCFCARSIIAEWIHQEQKWSGLSRLYIWECFAFGNRFFIRKYYFFCIVTEIYDSWKFSLALKKPRMTVEQWILMGISLLSANKQKKRPHVHGHAWLAKARGRAETFRKCALKTAALSAALQRWRPPGDLDCSLPQCLRDCGAMCRPFVDPFVLICF